MGKNLQVAQGILSIAALICIIIGWFHFLPEEISNFISKRLFYVLVGVSFVIQASLLVNRKFLYPMYIAAALCIVGAFLPVDSPLAGIKTIGLITGVIITFFNRQQAVR